MEKTPSPTITFFRALRNATGDAYDRLGLTLASSLLWFAALMAASIAVSAAARTQPVLVVLGVFCIGSVLLGEVWTGCVYLAYRIATRDDPSLLCFVEAWRGLGWKTLGLAVIQTFVTVVILANIALYLQSNLLFMRVFGVVILYLLLLWITAMLYQYPLLVEHVFGAYTAEQTKTSWVRRVLRRSLLLTIGNLPFSAGMFAIMTAWAIFCFISVVGLALMYAGFVSLATVHWTRALLINYGVIALPPEPEVIPDEQFRLPEE
ncbi:MAG: hypothetical protein KatS3mg023_0140 [Armatimonadota bacterium]|nr:MAG: hypothetical protein KatS3mg023_0140 [Armatimonadota bacterium]